jgi:Ca2+-binding EF-hand superfamily protein
MVDESLHCLFDIFDQDKTGYLERNELKSLLIALGESSSDSRIDRLVWNNLIFLFLFLIIL